MVTQGVSWEVPETVYAGHNLTEGRTDPFHNFLFATQMTSPPVLRTSETTQKNRR